MRFLRSIDGWLLSMAISLLLFLEAGAQNGLPGPFINRLDDGIVYNASFQYKSHHMSGLLVAKKEGPGYHFVMLSKMGPTLLDFVITGKKVTWNKTIKIMERPALKRALVTDFRTIFLTPLNAPDKVIRLKGHNFKVKKNIKVKIAVENKDRVIFAENRRFINLFKSFVTYYYTDEDLIPDEICLTHRNIKLKIELKYLPQ